MGPPKPPLRLPLVTGGSAVEYLLGVSIFGAIAGIPLFFLTLMPGWMALPLGLLAAAWMFGVLFTPWQLRDTRARDVLIDLEAGTVTVDRGPRHGEILPLGRAPELLADDAETLTDPEEIASRQALRETFHALAGVSPRSAPTGEGDDAIVLAICEACGAPAPASAEAQIPCERCGVSVAMPPTLRERVARGETSARAAEETEAALADLWRQPGPRATNWLVWLAAFPAIFAWPAAGVIFDEFFQLRGVFSRWYLPLLFATALSFSTALLLVLRIRVDARRAFGLVCLGFHARPPRALGDPPDCGGCGGPLSPTWPSAVERCRYCRVENVRTVLLPMPRAHLGKQLDDLHALLAARLARRSRDRRLLLVAAALLGMSFCVGRTPLRTAWTARRAPILEPSARQGLVGAPTE